MPGDQQPTLEREVLGHFGDDLLDFGVLLAEQLGGILGCLLFFEGLFGAGLSHADYNRRINCRLRVYGAVVRSR